MSEWNTQALEDGSHRVLHLDHDTEEWSEAGAFGPETSLEEVVALVTQQAADCDFILLPEGTPLVILDVPGRVPVSQ